MRKIQLDIESLQVESFATQPEAKALRGTVRALCSYTRDPVADCEVATASGPVACLCVSGGEQATCVGSCNPDMCSNYDSSCCPDTFYC